MMVAKVHIMVAKPELNNSNQNPTIPNAYPTITNDSLDHSNRKADATI